MKLFINGHGVDLTASPFGGVKIAVLLSKKDRENITNMAPEATLYCEADDSIPRDEVQKWLNDIHATEHNIEVLDR